MREKSRERGREGGKHGKKKFQRNPEVTGYRNNIERTTSFFFTNFPAETTASELWKLFSRYWKVGEVYIPDKLDKAGKRFGFARFEDVDDRQKLLEKIEATWIGTYKIRANLPKFTRGEGFKKPNMNMGTGVVINRGFPKVQTSGKTFKEIALGGSNGNTGIQKE
jgi:RNA recognition motif-containing protein